MMILTSWIITKKYRNKNSKNSFHCHLPYAIPLLERASLSVGELYSHITWEVLKSASLRQISARESIQLSSTTDGPSVTASYFLCHHNQRNWSVGEERHVRNSSSAKDGSAGAHLCRRPPCFYDRKWDLVRKTNSLWCIMRYRYRRIRATFHSPQLIKYKLRQLTVFIIPIPIMTWRYDLNKNFNQRQTERTMMHY